MVREEERMVQVLFHPGAERCVVQNLGFSCVGWSVSWLRLDEGARVDLTFLFLGVVGHERVPATHTHRQRGGERERDRQVLSIGPASGTDLGNV